MNRRTVLRRTGAAVTGLMALSGSASATGGMDRPTSNYHDCYWPHQDPTCYVDDGEPCPSWCCACL